MNTCVDNNNINFLSSATTKSGTPTVNYKNVDTFFRSHDKTKRLNSPDLEDVKIIELRAKVEQEFARHGQYTKIKKEIFDEVTKELVKNIVRVDYDKVVVELNTSGVLRFKLLKKKLKVIIGKQLSDTDLHRDEVVFSIFNGKEHVVSDVKNFYGLVQGLLTFKDLDL